MATTIKRLTLLILLCNLNMTGQIGPIYKAVLYNADGIEEIAKSMDMRVTIKDGGVIVYRESKVVQTDSLGTATYMFNTGTRTVGNDSTIAQLNHFNKEYFIMIEVDSTINTSTDYVVYSNSLITPTFYSYKAKEAMISKDNLFHLSDSVTQMNEDSGLLISMITKSKRDSIVTPPSGLLVYLSDIGDFSYYNGTQWLLLGNLEDLELLKKRINTRFYLLK